MSLSPSRIASNAFLRLNIATGRTNATPLLIFYPTSRCNSRCVSCDWWKSDGADDMTMGEISDLASQLPALGVRLVLFSGGEPLLRRETFDIADLFRAQGLSLHLLTSGLFLERDAEKVAASFENVTISLDGQTPDLYRKIRGVDGLAAVERGVKKLRAVSDTIPLRARSTLHRHNFRELPYLIDKAKQIGLDQISFLAADVTSEAFGRTQMRSSSSKRGLLLEEQEVQEFAGIVEETLRSHQSDFVNHFVAETPEKLRRLPKYYGAQLGLNPFPPVSCDAPWVSAVVEADGTVRPCYFHHSIGNIREKPLCEILGVDLRVFRSKLDVSRNAVCERCVCTLKVGLRSQLW